MDTVELNHQKPRKNDLERLEERIADLEEKIKKMENGVEKKKGTEDDYFYLSAKQLMSYLNMSWNSIREHLLYDPEFPYNRLGPRYLFRKEEIDNYMDKHYHAVRHNGGDIIKYRKKAS